MITIQALKYIVAVAEAKSFTEAAKRLKISQPSLSSAVKNAEKELGFKVFSRRRTGVSLTRDGVEFMGYARQIIQDMDLLEDRYLSGLPLKKRFCVSTQHYSFTAYAFTDMVKKYDSDRYEFILNETQTHQVLEDARNGFCDLGILYLSDDNSPFLLKKIDEMGLQFNELFAVTPHVFLRAGHPLADREKLSLRDLEPYPRFNFLQGDYESSDYSEEPFSTMPSDKIIRINDRGAIVDLLIGLDGYTVSSGIAPGYLRDNMIVSVPLEEEGTMIIGYVLPKDQELSDLAEIYVDSLKKFDPSKTFPEE